MNSLNNRTLTNSDLFYNYINELDNNACDKLSVGNNLISTITTELDSVKVTDSNSLETSGEILFNSNSVKETVEFSNSNLNLIKPSDTNKLSSNSSSSKTTTPQFSEEADIELTRSAIDYLESKYELIKPIFEMHNKSMKMGKIINYSSLIDDMKVKLPELELKYFKEKNKEERIMTCFCRLHLKNQCFYTVFASLNLDAMNIDSQILQNCDRKLYFTIYLQFCKKGN